MAGLAAIFGYLLIFHYHHESKDNGGHLGDFRTFYQAAQFALEHRDIYTAGHNSSQMYIYPPLLAFLFTPLTCLSELAAAHVYLVLSVIILLVSLLRGARAMLERFDACYPGAAFVGAFLIAVLSINELKAQLTMLESDSLMLLMFTLALCWLDRRPIMAGLALALAFNIKYLSIVALPYLILRRRWKAAGAMVVGTIGFALLPALLLGWHENLRCLHIALGGLLRWVGVPPEASHAVRVHNIGDDLSVSITSALARILSPHGLSNAGIMAFATALGLLTLAIVTWMYRMNGHSLWRWPAASRQREQPFRGLVAAEWAGLVTIALVFSPDTNTRHLVLAVLVSALAAAVLMTKRAGISRAPALIAVIVIFLGFIMPFGAKGTAMHHFYFRYGIPCWGLLIGYLLILWTGLRQLVWHEEGAR